MASMNNRLNIEKLDGILYKSIEVQNKLGSNNLVLVLKQESMEYMVKNVFGLRWNCRELKGIMKLRFFRNMSFNESGEYKKTFIGSSVGTSSMQVLHEFEFEVEPLGDHTFEVEPQENIDQGAGLQEV
nr:hypothetical protein [Tanacetum cinerariifolium]